MKATMETSAAPQTRDVNCICRVDGKLAVALRRRSCTRVGTTTACRDASVIVDHADDPSRGPRTRSVGFRRHEHPSRDRKDVGQVVAVAAR
jgi:hypothetical protein